MRDDPELDFLVKLAEPATAEAGWSAFLQRFSPLLLKVARRHAGSDRDDVLDYYLHVCRCLVEDGFRRLRAFRQGGRGEFAAWLQAVARNLCIDHLRAERGRRRLPAAVARLDEVDREVFAAVYWEGRSAGEALQELRSRRPTLDEARVELALRRVGAALRPWQLAEIALGVRPLVALEPEVIEALPDPRPDAEAEYLSREELERLRAEVALLPAADQALLRLRFEQGLTHAQAARALGFGDFHQAHERLAKVLAVLRQRLAARGDRVPSEAARGDRVPSEAARGNRVPSEAARGDRVPSEAARGNRAPSEAARGNRAPSGDGGDWG